MLSVGYQFYLAFLLPGIVSFFASAAVISTYAIFPNLRKGSLYKHMVCLHIADIIQVCSWFIGPKFTSIGASPFVCATQEYMFQYGSTCKALWTSAICVLTYQSLLNMKLSSEDRFVKKACMCFGLPLIFVSLSAYFRTYQVFCGDHFHSSLKDDREISYLVLFVGALYIAICVNIFVTLLVYLKIRNLYSTGTGSTTADSHRTRLLSLCKILTLYPVIYSISWAPEVVYLFAREYELGIYTGASVNMTGTWFAMIFFLSNQNAKKYWRDFISVKSSEVFSRFGGSVFSGFQSQQRSAAEGGSEGSSVHHSKYEMSTTSFASTVFDDRTCLNSTDTAFGKSLLGINAPLSSQHVGDAPLGYK